MLRAVPRLQAGADSGLGTGQSIVRADPGHSRVLGLPEGGPAAAAATGSPGPGGSRQLPESRDRSGFDRPPLGSSSPLQGDIEGVHRVGQAQAEVLYPDQVADSPPPPPTVRRGTRVKNPTNFYQAGLD